MATTENTWSDNDVATAALLNNLEDTVIVRCDSASRPTGVEGRLIFETDTNKLMIYDGSAWRLAGGSGWTSFTPTWTNLTVGSGTNVGEYRYADGGMWVRGSFTYGSGSAVGTAPRLTLPASATMPSDVQLMPRGWGMLKDATGNNNPSPIAHYDTTHVIFYVQTISNGYLALVDITASIPFTWATSDAITYQFFAPLA